MFEALFILTIIDAGTRVGRYLLQELGGHIYKPLGDVNWKPGVIITSALMSFTWGYLVYGGSISSIWPLFGLSNQLLASMALAIGTTIIFRMGKGKYALTTLIPLLFMFVTAFTAGIYNIFVFYLPKGEYLLAVCSVVMFVMLNIMVKRIAIFVILKAIKIKKGHIVKKR